MNKEITTALIRVLPFAVIIFVVFLRIKLKKLDRQELYLYRPYSIGLFYLWTVGFLVFILLTEYVLYTLEILEIDPWNHALFSSIIRISGAIILAPIAEELIFRGIILNVLAKRNVNKHLAIFIQTCFFILLHNFTYQNTLTSNIGVVQSLIDAMLYGYAKYHTRSLYTPIGMHMTGNLVATIERFIF